LLKHSYRFFGNVAKKSPAIPTSTNFTFSVRTTTVVSSKNQTIQKKSSENMVENNGIELTEQETELYDRQIRLWGLDSQKRYAFCDSITPNRINIFNTTMNVCIYRLRAARILLCGLNGFGAEIAKNIILAGVKSITL